MKFVVFHENCKDPLPAAQARMWIAMWLFLVAVSIVSVGFIVVLTVGFLVGLL